MSKAEEIAIAVVKRAAYEEARTKFVLRAVNLALEWAAQQCEDDGFAHRSVACAERIREGRSA